MECMKTRMDGAYLVQVYEYLGRRKNNQNSAFRIFLDVQGAEGQINLSLFTGFNEFMNDKKSGYLEFSQKAKILN